MNSGDWVETMSALVEDYDNQWSIVYFSMAETLEIEKVSKKKSMKTIAATL